MKMGYVYTIETLLSVQGCFTALPKHINPRAPYIMVPQQHTAKPKAKKGHSKHRHNERKRRKKQRHQGAKKNDIRHRSSRDLNQSLDEANDDGNTAIETNNNVMKPLEMSKDRYRVNQHCSEVEKVLRNVKSLLNKVTPEKMDVIAGKLAAEIWKNDNVMEDMTNDFVNLVFDKAVLEMRFAQVYADLCHRLCHISDPHRDYANQSLRFQRLLITKCQDTFENRLQLDSSSKSQTYNEKDQARQRSKGLMHLFGQLYLHGVLADCVIVDCFRVLLHEVDEKPDDVNIEDACTLMSIVGTKFNAKHNKDAILDVIFETLARVSRHDCVSKRVRFTVIALLELRDAQWKARRYIEAPTTLKKARGGESSTRRGASSRQPFRKHNATPTSSTSDVPQSFDSQRCEFRHGGTTTLGTSSGVRVDQVPFPQPGNSRMIDEGVASGDHGPHGKVHAFAFPVEVFPGTSPSLLNEAIDDLRHANRLRKSTQQQHGDETFYPKEKGEFRPVCESVHSPNTMGDGECEWHEDTIQDENITFVENGDEPYERGESSNMLVDEAEVESDESVTISDDIAQHHISCVGYDESADDGDLEGSLNNGDTSEYNSIEAPQGLPRRRHFKWFVVFAEASNRCIRSIKNKLCGSL